MLVKKKLTDRSASLLPVMTFDRFRERRKYSMQFQCCHFFIVSSYFLSNEENEALRQVFTIILVF